MRKLYNRYRTLIKTLPTRPQTWMWHILRHDSGEKSKDGRKEKKTSTKVEKVTRPLDGKEWQTKLQATEIEWHKTGKVGVIGVLNLFNDRAPEEVSKNRLARHQLNSVLSSYRCFMLCLVCV